MLQSSGKPLSGISFSIVIPFFNEEKNVVPVMDELVKTLDRQSFTYEIIPVNNGSTDRTGNALDRYSSLEQVRIVTVEKNEGFGWGIRQGIQAAQGEWICFFGGDGQTHPMDVVRILEAALEEKHASILTGCRILRKDGILRLVLSKVFNVCFNLLFDMRIKDVNGTPKVIRRDFISQIKIETKGWFIDAELLIWAKVLRKKVLQYPVIFRQRKAGRTHINMAAVIEFIWRMIFFYFKQRSLSE